MSTWGNTIAPQGEPRRGPAPSVTATNGSRYGQTALEAEARKVAEAPEGTRNDTLNAAAFALGQLVAGGELIESDAQQALESAAKSCGLGETEASKTIASGLSSGKDEPRSAPPRELATVTSLSTAPPEQGFGPEDYDDETNQAGATGSAERSPSGDGSRSESKPPRILTLEQRLHARRGMGPRIPTGIEALDALLRGGIRPQQVMVIGGAPGAGKTTMGVQVARGMARSGVAVAWLAIDEEPAGIDARNLESIGVPRDLAEEPDDATIARAVAELGPLPWLMLDDATVEDAFVQLARLYPNHQRAVFIDSIQTAWTTTSGTIPSIRERISDVIQTAKRCARQDETKAAVFLTSELARGAYRSRNTAEQIEDLAAFKESGAIEYQGHVLLVLRTDPEDAAAVAVTVPKNRIGRRGTFGLRLDFSTATFTERELPVAPTVSHGELSRRVLDVLRETPDVSGSVVVARTGARRQDVYTAIEDLAANCLITNVGTDKRPTWRVAVVENWHDDE